MKLDLRHIGDKIIKEKLGGIREISLKFTGVDPAQEILLLLRYVLLTRHLHHFLTELLRLVLNL